MIEPDVKSWDDDDEDDDEDWDESLYREPYYPNPDSPAPYEEGWDEYGEIPEEKWFDEAKFYDSIREDFRKNHGIEPEEFFGVNVDEKLFGKSEHLKKRVRVRKPPQELTIEQQMAWENLLTPSDD